MVPLGAFHKKFLVTRKIKIKQSNENLRFLEVSNVIHLDILKCYKIAENMSKPFSLP